jgi:uncharacterized membrane protein
MYPPFTYVLHLPGMIIAKILTDKSLYFGYAVRFSAFLLAWIFLFLLIKKNPYKQKTLFVLSLAPVFLYQTTSISGDALINLVTLLSIGTALIFAASQDEYKLSSKALLIIALLSFFATLGKVVYFPIALIFLLIPSSKFENPKHWKIFFIVLFGICVLSNVSWLLLWKLHIVTYKTATVAGGGDVSSALSTLANSNTGLQMQAALKNPGELLKVIWEAFVYGNRHAIFKAFTSDFGYGTDFIPANKIIAILYLFCIIAVSFSDRYGSAISYKRLFFILFISAFLIALGVFAPGAKNYLTAPGVFLENFKAAKMEGVLTTDPRYLFPSVAIFLMCLNSKRIRFNSELILQYCLPIICFVNLFVLSKIVLHFAR